MISPKVCGRSLLTLKNLEQLKASRTTSLSNLATHTIVPSFRLENCKSRTRAITAFAFDHTRQEKTGLEAERVMSRSYLWGCLIL